MPAQPLTAQQRSIAEDTLKNTVLPNVYSQNLTKDEAVVLLNKSIFRRTRNSYFKVTKSQLDTIYAAISDGQPWPSILMVRAVDDYLDSMAIDGMQMSDIVTNIQNASGFMGIDWAMVQSRLNRHGYTYNDDTGQILSTVEIPVLDTPEQATTESQRVVYQGDLDRAIASVTSVYEQRIRVLELTVQHLKLSFEAMQNRVTQIEGTRVATCPPADVFSPAVTPESLAQLNNNNMDFNGRYGS